MNLTKRQEIQLNKVFDNPKKLRKWIDDVYIYHYILIYLNLYNP